MIKNLGLYTLFCLGVFLLVVRYTANQQKAPLVIKKSQDLFQMNTNTLPIPTINSLPNMSSDYYILLDAKTNQILVSRNINDPIYPASTTKLATALTALNNYPLNETVVITELHKDGKTMGLRLGQSYTVDNLLRALLVYSANDVAFALANHHPSGVTGFINEMNNLARSLNMTNTKFMNFDGNDNPEHVSTVYDLSQLGRASLKLNYVLNIVKEKQTLVTTIDGKDKYSLVTTNELLGKYPEVVGLKTGWTPTAGEAFVGYIKYNEHDFISVVANSRDRFGDTVRLLSWLKSNFAWR